MSMNIKQLLETLRDRELPFVREDVVILDVLEKILGHPHTRLVYVLDEDGGYRGTISLGILIRHLFPHGFEPAIHARHLIPMITCARARDIMDREMLYAQVDDDVESVLKRMIDAGVKEIAVLDQEKKLIGDLTMLDLLKHYHLPR
jgi:CBS domain-containing protein